MSHRYDTALIPGAHVYGVGSLGVLGSAIPSTGESGAGYAYNDLLLPADASKEIHGRVTTWPSNGTLIAYEDTSFDYTALSGVVDSFAYQLYVDGVATGSPTTVTLGIGTVDAVATGTPASLSIIAPTATAVGTAAGEGLAFGTPASIMLSAPTATASGTASVVNGYATGTVASLNVTAPMGTALGSVLTGFTDSQKIDLILAKLALITPESIATAILAATLPSNLTTIQIALAVRRELNTELERLDAPISSRMLKNTVVKADVLSINGDLVVGSGTKIDPWRPA